MSRTATHAVTRRHRPTRWLAALAVLAAAVPTLLATTAMPASAAGTVTLSKSADLTDAETITVSGSGFDSTRGIYVMFCQQTSERPAGADCSGAQQWISDSDLAQGADGTVRWSGPGSFSVSLSVSQTWGTVDCKAVTCGVVTRNDHMDRGLTDQDTFTPVSFADEQTEPTVTSTTTTTTTTTTAPTDGTTTTSTTTEPGGGDGDDAGAPLETRNDTRITLSKSTDLAGGEVITVSGTGFAPEQGIYVQNCVAPAGTLGTAEGRTVKCYPDQDGERTVWLTPVPADGAWATPFTVADTFGDVDCRVQGCGVFVRRDHSGGGADFSQDAFVPISFGDPSTTPSTTPGQTGARLTVTPATGIVSGSTVTVEGAGFRAGHEIFVGVCDTAVPSFAACDFDNVQQVTVDHGGTARAGGPGTFVTEIVARAEFGGTDCAAIASRCAVTTWAVSGNDVALEVSAAIGFASAGAPGAPGSGSSGSQGGSGGSAPLARTGSNSTDLVLVGSASLLVGAALFVVGRRRMV